MRKLSSFLVGVGLGVAMTSSYAQVALEDQLEMLEGRLWSVINSTDPSSVKEFGELLKAIDETKVSIRKRDANPRRNVAVVPKPVQKTEPIVVIKPSTNSSVVPSDESVVAIPTVDKPSASRAVVPPVESVLIPNTKPSVSKDIVPTTESVVAIPSTSVDMAMLPPDESVVAIPTTEPAVVFANLNKQVIVDRSTYTMRVYNNGEVVDTQRVVIGRPERPTPAFSSVITHVVLNPYWNVSPNIATLDIAPLFLNSPKLAIERGYEVFDGWTDKSPEVDPLTVDWSKYGANKLQVPYMVRQKPGPENVLGKIKFIVKSTEPINQGIFLHGTVDPSLFDEPVREFSSGCVRVENDVHLAKILINGDSSLSESDIQRQVDTGVTKWIKLETPIEMTIK